MKTTFASLYPNAIILASECGYKAQVANVKDITCWDDLVEFIDLLEENREDVEDSIQTIVIDTVDELYPMASRYVIRKQSIRDKTKYNEIKDIPYGQGWNYHDEEFRFQIKRILNMGFTILYLTHTIVKTIKPKNGEAYDIYKSTMSDRCASIVYPACDYIIHGERRRVNLDNGDSAMKRVLTVKGSDDVIAGNRVYFKEEIIFETEEEAMEKFQKQFKESIEFNLRKAGIKDDIKKLEEKQNEERHEKVKEYLETKDNNIDELKKKIRKLAGQKLKEGFNKEEVENAVGKSLNFETVEEAQDVLKKLNEMKK